MKMKKFTGSTMPEVMKSVKNELGDDAVILSSRTVRSKGFFGLFRKKRFEVMAALDMPVKVQPIPEPGFDVRKEILDMKKMIEHIHAETPKSAAEELRAQYGLSAKSVEGIQLTAPSIDGQRRQFEKEIHAKLNSLPMGKQPTEKKYVALFGPTGVGKTTTIAKLAAEAVLKGKKKVGFITTDTYRIAAFEQLKVYAGLLRAPVEVVYSPADLQAAAEKLADKELIFIDTAGRNFKEDTYVQELQKLIDFDKEVQSYLAVSATSKEEDLKRVIENFRHFEMDQLIVTKIDETESVGSIFNCLIEYGLGVAFITDGQEVPEDIEEATSEKLVSLLFEEKEYV